MLSKDLETTISAIDMVKDASLAAIGDAFIFGFAAGGDIGAPGHFAILLAHMATKLSLLTVDGVRFRLTTKDVESKQKDLVTWSKEIAEKQLDQDIKDAVLELGDVMSEVQGHLWTINEKLREVDDASREYSAVLAEGDRLQSELATFRQRSAGVVQGFRTRDAAFRIFRNEK